MIFASLNVGLQRSEACGEKNAERNFKAIARGVAKAFRNVGVHAMGLVELGGTVQGLPTQQSERLIEHIHAETAPDIQLDVHANAHGSPYMLLSNAAVLGACRVTSVRLVKNFLQQKWR